MIIIPLRILGVDRQFGEAFGQELPFGWRGTEGERGPVGVVGLSRASQPPQQVSPASMQEVPSLAPAAIAELIEDRQACGRSLGHRHRDGAVGLDHR
jgi:hypothetical protein